MKQHTTITTASQVEIRTITDVKHDVDQVLAAHYDAQRLRGRAISPDFDFLWQAASHQNQAGGKRLRPYLCLLTYEALGGKHYHDAIPVAAALELLHSAMLIHDDIIDRDYVRRNELNVAGLYQKKYAALVHDGIEKDHFANAAALLAGDLVLSDAYQLVLMSGMADNTKIKMSKLIGDAIYTVVAGELLDSEAALYPLERADSLKIAELKTALYSFATPLMAGAILAGTNEHAQQQLQKLGVRIGVAFQLADDLLGIFGNQEETGKSTIGDIREGKRTYLLQQTMAKASAEEQRVLAGIVGNPACTNQMADQARAIMISSGAKSEVEQLMQNYAAEAEALLDSLGLRSGYKQEFQAFIQKAIWRNR